MLLIFETVCHPNEAFMDIEQANRMTNILREQTRTLANEQFTITPQDYVSAIQREFGINNNDPSSQNSQEEEDEVPAEVDWAAIGQRMAPWFLTIPSIQFMFSILIQNLCLASGLCNGNQLKAFLFIFKPLSICFIIYRKYVVALFALFALSVNS